MKKELIAAAAWAAVMLTLAIGAKVAHQLGYIDRETVQRVVTAPIGLWMVWYGNRIPKMTFTRNAQARQAQRVSAWSQVVSGLAFAALWAFAPLPVAIPGGVVAVVAGVAVTFGYCLSLRSKANAA